MSTSAQLLFIPVAEAPQSDSQWSPLPWCTLLTAGVVQTGLEATRTSAAIVSVSGRCYAQAESDSIKLDRK